MPDFGVVFQEAIDFLRERLAMSPAEWVELIAEVDAAARDRSAGMSDALARDILEAIMFPSKVVSDQYQGVEVELDDFTTVTGMLAGESDDAITLITIDGERREIPRATITKQTEAGQSIMPEGLLHTMTLKELVSLIYFLEHGADEK